MSFPSPGFRNLLKDRFKFYLVLFLLILYGGFLFWQGGPSSSSLSKSAEIQFFYHPQCPHCREQDPFNRELNRKYPFLHWSRHDVSNPEENALFLETARKRGISQESLGVPATFFGDSYFIGFDRAETTGARIEAALRDYLLGKTSGKGSVPGSTPTRIELPFVGVVEPRDFSLGTLAVLLGLADGFNPCAMWVLVYLISLVVTLKDRTKIWVLVGSFVLASGVLYFLFLSAWLNAFLFIGYVRPVTLAIGLFAIGVGILSLREFFTTRGLVCEVGDADSKKKTTTRIARLVQSPLSLAAVGGIVILAFAVNSIEFVCSAGIPAVFTHVLSLVSLSPLQYYGYLLLYDFFFMLDDLVIFGLAAFAAQKTLGERYARWGKLLGGILLFGLGILLVIAPQRLG